MAEEKKTLEDLGAAVAARIAMRPIVTANSISELPLDCLNLFNWSSFILF